MCFHGDAESEVSKEIEKKLKEDHKQKRITLLLLGAGESGKSTVAKQMKILHLNGFTEDECRAFREVVYSNILSCIKTLAAAAEEFGLKPRDAALAERVAAVGGAADLNAQMFADIGALWRDEAITQAWARASEFQLIDSARYWFEHLERIGAAGAGYVPSVDDILHARQMTTGIVEMDWETSGYHFKMVDVGGQRNHRAKWIHCFDGVTAVIFCVALSEYDQVLREDETKNRMHESLDLFDQLANSEWFWRTPFMIFFNKKDLFAEKIKRVDLKTCFPEYTGAAGDYDAALQYISDRFMDLDQKRSHTRKIYPHFTQATDTNNIRAVYEVVRDIVVRQQIGAVFG